MKFLNTKLWKLPYWAWGLILVAVIAAFIIYRRNSGGAATAGSPSSGLLGNQLPFPQQPAPLPPIGIGSTPTGSSGIPGPADVPAAPLAAVGTSGLLPTTLLSAPVAIGINSAAPGPGDPGFRSQYNNQGVGSLLGGLNAITQAAGNIQQPSNPPNQVARNVPVPR